MKSLSKEISKTIKARRDQFSSPSFGKDSLIKFLNLSLSLLLPHFNKSSYSKISSEWSSLGVKLFKSDLKLIEKHLPEIQRKIISDGDAILKGDPAAVSFEEVVLCYPGFFAAAVHRVAHALSIEGMKLIPRILSEHAHEKTGIDIHPGAQIGEAFCIDHGTGIVVGETCEIGNRVKLYQGVTLGALSVRKDLASKKRHPTIEDDVVIYANATLLGPIIIGRKSVVGGNAWVTESLPENSKVRMENR